tara:strand:+ start:2354 stop:2572 length:219 start_codon:yes stop_codon:yes gene_type:complete
MKFKPTQYDLDWTRGLIASLEEGGIWSYRNAPIAIQFFHSKKEYSFISKVLGKDPNVEKVKVVLNKLNWKEV